MNGPAQAPLARSNHTLPASADPRRRVCCSIDMACSPATLYAVWADVERWHTWDPDTRWARLSGPMTVGSHGRIAPKKGLPLDMTVREAAADKSFTVTCRVLGSAMHFEHFLERTAHGVRATHQVHFEGWLAGVLMRTVGADLAKGLPVTLARLKRLCEARQAASDADMAGASGPHAPSD